MVLVFREYLWASTVSWQFDFLGRGLAGRHCVGLSSWELSGWNWMLYLRVMTLIPRCQRCADRLKRWGYRGWVAVGRRVILGKRAKQVLKRPSRQKSLWGVRFEVLRVEIVVTRKSGTWRKWPRRIYKLYKRLPTSKWHHLKQNAWSCPCKYCAWRIFLKTRVDLILGILSQYRQRHWRSSSARIPPYLKSYVNQIKINELQLLIT